MAPPASSGGRLFPRRVWPYEWRGLGTNMLQFWRGQLRRRPWIAVAVAYALALQLALGGVLASQTADAGTIDGALVICSAHGGAIDHNGGAPADDHAQCTLCCLGKTVGAVLPDFHRLPVRAAAYFEPAAQRATTPRIRHARTTHYQRGPPAGVIAAG